MFSTPSPWKDRQQVTKTDLLWQAHDLVMNVIVFCHYTLRKKEATLSRPTRTALNDTLRYSKGIAVFWQRWLLSTHPRATTVPALPQPPTTDDGTLSAGHAAASRVEHED